VCISLIKFFPETNHVEDKIFRSKHEIILEKYFNVFEDVFEKSNTFIYVKLKYLKKVFKYFQIQMYLTLIPAARISVSQSYIYVCVCWTLIFVFHFISTFRDCLRYLNTVIYTKMAVKTNYCVSLLSYMIKLIISRHLVIHFLHYTGEGHRRARFCTDIKTTDRSSSSTWFYLFQSKPI